MLRLARPRTMFLGKGDFRAPRRYEPAWCCVGSCPNYGMMADTCALWLFDLPNEETEASLREAWLAQLGSALVWKDEADNPIDPLVCFRHFAQSDFIGNVDGRPRGLKLDAVPSVLTPEPRGPWPGCSFMAAAMEATAQTGAALGSLPSVLVRRRGRPPGGGRAWGRRGRGRGGGMASRFVVAGWGSGPRRGEKRRGRPPLRRVTSSASNVTEHRRGTKRRGRPPSRRTNIARSASESSNPDVNDHHGEVDGGHLSQSKPTVTSNTTEAGRGGDDDEEPTIVRVVPGRPQLPRGKHIVEKEYWGDPDDGVIFCRVVWIPEPSFGDFEN